MFSTFCIYCISSTILTTSATTIFIYSKRCVGCREIICFINLVSSMTITYPFSIIFRIIVWINSIRKVISWWKRSKFYSIESLIHPVINMWNFVKKVTWVLHVDRIFPRMYIIALAMSDGKTPYFVHMSCLRISAWPFIQPFVSAVPRSDGPSSHLASTHNVCTRIYTTVRRTIYIYQLFCFVGF